MVLVVPPPKSQPYFIPNTWDGRLKKPSTKQYAQPQPGSGGQRADFREALAILISRRRPDAQHVWVRGELQSKT